MGEVNEADKKRAARRTWLLDGFLTFAGQVVVVALVLGVYHFWVIGKQPRIVAVDAVGFGISQMELVSSHTITVEQMKKNNLAFAEWVRANHSGDIVLEAGAVVQGVPVYEYAIKK